MKEFAYYKFIDLPESERMGNGIRLGTKRLDCVEIFNPINYRGLDYCMNKKGMMYIYRTPSREIVRANTKRRAEYALSHGSVNITSIWNEYTEDMSLCYGSPNPNKTIGRKNPKPNPFYSFGTDLYLLIVNSTYTEIEFIIFPGMRNLSMSYYQKLIDGKLNEKIQLCRTNSKPFFNYGKVA